MKSLRPIVALSCLLAASLPGYGLNARSRSSNAGSGAARRPRYRAIAWNPVFRGSRESLILQNEEIDRLQLPRISDEEQLQQLIDRGDLLPLPDNQYVSVSIAKPAHRYCKAWTRDFLEDLGEAYYQEFGRPIVVTSAVRPADYQHRLRRHNRNAAPETGETASSHMAGITVDILKRGMTRRQRQWLNDYMTPLKAQGLIEPEEERRQPVYHVMVSARYSERQASVQPVSDPAPQLLGVVPGEAVADK